MESLLARRPTRRHQGVHQENRTVHRQHRADRKRRIYPRHRARPSLRPRVLRQPGQRRVQAAWPSGAGEDSRQRNRQGQTSHRGQPRPRRPKSRRHAREAAQRRTRQYGQLAQVLPRGRGCSRPLPPIRPHDGVGHRRRTMHPRGGRWRCLHPRRLPLGLRQGRPSQPLHHRRRPPHNRLESTATQRLSIVFDWPGGWFSYLDLVITVETVSVCNACLSKFSPSTGKL